MEVGGNALDSGLALAVSPVSASCQAFCNMIGPPRNGLSVVDHTDLSLKDYYYSCAMR